MEISVGKNPWVLRRKSPGVGGSEQRKDEGFQKVLVSQKKSQGQQKRGPFKKGNSC